MSDLLMASKAIKWLEKNNGVIGSVSLGVVVLAMILAILHFAPRTDLSGMRADMAQMREDMSSIRNDVSLIQQDTAAIRRTQEEHGERIINIQQQMGYMYNRLNGIDDRFNVYMSEMHVLGERVNKNEKDIIRIQNAR